MYRINIRLRIAILTGIIIMVSSLVTSFYSVANANQSIDQTASVVYDRATIRSNETFEVNGSPMKEESLFETTLSDSIVSDLKDEFFFDQLWFSAFISVVGMFLSYLIAGWILKPIRSFADEISNIQMDDLDYQIPVWDHKDVVGVLTIHFNELLSRLNKYVKRQKDYSSNVAHELKTPLTVMKTSLQVLDEDSDIEEYRETFAIQEKNIARLEKIVNDLLLFKEEELKLEEININLILKEVIDEYRYALDEHHIQLNIKEETIMTSGNHALVHRLFSNLFSNAIRYNKEGGSIYIEVLNNSISIRDTGIGIDEKHQSEIFEPFYCIDKSKSYNLGGSGLGLSLVKSICDALEYKIEVSSKLDYGTEFVIYFKKD